MYKVIKDFADKEDKGFIYHIGDEYPRKGFETTDARVEELIGDDNKIGEPLIVAVKPVEEEKTEAEPREVRKSRAKSKDK